jgi:peptidoglycan/xylan/chitin deacetylase (PgdA/CDA1 family)
MAIEKTFGGGSASYGRRIVGTQPTNPFASHKGETQRHNAFEKNQLVIEKPTLRARPYNRADTLEAVFAPAGGGTIELSTTVIDPMTGLATAKVTIPAESTTYQGIQFYELEPWQMQPHDSWFISVYLPVKVSNFVLQLLVTDADSIAGVNYRSIAISGGTNELRPGWNIIHVLHVEERVDANTYKTIGTTEHAPWVNTGLQTDSSMSRSLLVRVRTTTTASLDPIDVYIGSVHTAPQGWTKSAWMWMADDVPKSFYDLALPILESYGWKAALAVTSGYMADPTAGANTYMSVEDVLDSYNRGHEIWGHTRLHENMSTGTTAGKTRALKAMVDAFNAIGIGTASKFLAWPFGAYDDESVAIAKTLGIRLARGIQGEFESPFTPGLNPYGLTAYSIETANSWRVDTMIRGNILRGTATITYSHTAVEGGTGINVRPASSSFYIEHFKRWCETVARYEQEGKVQVTTPLEYLRMVGIDPYTDNLVE